MTTSGTESVISLRGVDRKYRRVHALTEVNLEIPSPGVYGLLGRNGAGKSTLLRIIAGQELPSTGQVRVFGGSPFENPSVNQRICLIREDQVFPADAEVHHALAMAEAAMPRWSSDLANDLMRRFSLPTKRSVGKLSRGQRSALGCVLGLAGRAPLTLFDEPTVGMDAVARQHFQDALISELAQDPRTILLSTHLIEDVASVLESVIVLSAGRVHLIGPTEDLLQNTAQVSGPTELVHARTTLCQVLDEQRLSGVSRVIVRGAAEEIATLHADPDLQVEPLTLQQAVVSLLAEDIQPQPHGAKS